MAAILQIRRGTNASTGSITFSESELFYNQSKETLQIANGANSLVTLARLDRINTGSLQLTGDFTASNALFTGDITFGGSLITLGDSNTDNIVIGGELSSSIIPNNDNSFDLGSETRRYKSIFSVSGSISNINGVDFTTFVTSTNTFTSSQETKNTALGTYTSSIDSKFTTLGTYTSSIDAKFTTLASYTGSVDTQLTQLFSTASNHESRIVYLSGSFSQSVDNRLDQLETTSGSVTSSIAALNEFTTSQNTKNTALGTYTSSIDAKFTTLGTYTSSIDDKFTTLGTYTSSIDAKFTTLGTYTASVNADLTNLHTYTASINADLTNLHTYTSSIDSKFSTLSTYTSSIDSKFVAVGITTASLNAYTASQDTKNATLATYTASVNADLTNLHTYTASVNSDLTNLHTYTSSLKSAIDVSGQNLTIYGDLTVQGNTTTLNTTELIVEDKLLALASGSTTSAQADGAGLYISGANVSITWNDANSLLNINQKVSSSVGFKGNGSELTGVIASAVDYANITNKPTLVSGSSQVTSSLDFRYLTIDGDSVVSGSSQIDLTATTNYISGIKTRLNAEGVISGSTQITNGSGLLSSSYTNFSNYTASVTNDLNALHSFTSSQETKNTTLGTYTSSIDSKFTTLGTYTSSIDSKFNTLGTYTASVNADLSTLHSYTASNDTNITNLFNTASQYSAFSSSINTTIKTKLDVEGVVSGSTDSSTIDFTITNGIITGNVIGGVVSGSSQVTQSLDARYELSGSVSQLVGIRAVSGSLGSAAWYNVTSSGDIALVSGSITYNNNHLLTAGATKKYIDWRTDEILTAIAVADITSVTAGNGLSGGGLAGDVTLSLDTNSATFTTGVKNKLDTDGVISGSSQVIGILGSLNSFTQSYFSGDSASFDSRLDGLEAYSSSLLVPTASLSLRTLQTDVYAKNTTGAQINKGTVVRISGNTGDNALITTASYDSEGLSANTLGVTTADIPNDSFGYVISEGILIGVNTDGMTAGDLLYLGANGSFTTTAPNAPLHGVRLGQVLRPHATVGSIYVRIDNGIELGEAHNVIDNSTTASYGDILMKSGSVWVNNSTFSASVDNRLDTLEGTPTESPLTFSDTSTIDFTRTTNTITANVIGGVVSGSTQVKDLLPAGTISGSIQVLGGTGIVSGSSQVTTLLPTGTVSGSSQVIGILSSLNTYTQSNDTTNTAQNNRLTSIESVTASLSSTYEEKASATHTLVSGSSQLTSSYDNRYVTLASDQTISGTKTFNNIVVNGTGSFARIESVTSQATIIGNSYVVVNTSTPTSRYAGLSVYDSGSTLSTASFYFDGELNDWNYEYSSSAGIDYAVTIFGPEYSTKGSPTYPANNKVQKGSGTHHLADSNITDSGTLITLGSNSVVNGTFYATGTVLVSGSSQIDLTGTTNYISGIKTRLDAESVVSGSTQITKSLQNVTDVGATTSNAITISNSTASTTSTTGALIVTGGVGVGGSVNVAGDVVAYSSSDRRLKNEITPIENPLQKINAIGGYSFVWNEDAQNTYKGKDYGVIAQEIEEILPELVDNRENGYKAVKYDRLVSLLIEGIKDLSNQVEELKQQINKG